MKKNDITGLGVPVSSRSKKHSPKGGKKDSPKIAPLLAALIPMVAGQMQKDSQQAGQYAQGVGQGKYGGKQEGPKTISGGGSLSLDSLKSKGGIRLEANKAAQESVQDDMKKKEVEL